MKPTNEIGCPLRMVLSHIYFCGKLINAYFHINCISLEKSILHWPGGLKMKTHIMGKDNNILFSTDALTKDPLHE